MALTLRNENDTRPRFEYYPLNSPTLRTVVVEDLPFTIGRGENVQLQIKSNSISREHAQVTQTSAGFLLRDLNSTNGTAINGQPVSKAFLEDGDSIAIAETELTFVCTTSGSIERMVTQPLVDKRKINPQDELESAILSSRALNEALLWQAIPLSSSRIVDYKTKVEQATLVSVDEPLASQLHTNEACDICSTTSRIQLLAWQLAAEHADDISSTGTILMRVELHAGMDDRLCYALDQAFECLSNHQSLGVILPWEWAVQSPKSIKLCAELRDLGAVLAYDRFSGGATCIDDMELASPDFLVLAPTLARGISTHSRRMRQLKKVGSNCEAADIQIVLPSGLPEEDFQAGSDIGLHLLIGNASSSSNTHQPIKVSGSV